MPTELARSFYQRLLSLETRTHFLFPPEAIPSDFRQSAVLIPFWIEDGDIRTLLTRRSSKLRSHSGQVAFAGGMLDPGETFEAAALREAHEEVGLAPSQVQVLGRLDDAWSGARSHLVPFVAWLDQIPSWAPNPSEVAEIMTPRLSDLLREEACTTEEVEVDGVVYVNATLSWPGGSAYGLTADLLIEALEWGTGKASSRGEVRLGELRSYYSAALTGDAKPPQALEQTRKSAPSNSDDSLG
jgi:8-oxo-dGTP pyrophosphatase MutT (NUDIX family)